MTGFNTTHFGYKDDPTPDSDTEAGNGKWGKLVDGDSLALNDTMAKMVGAKPGDKIELKDAKGNTRVGTYIDKVPDKDGPGPRLDIYNPTGSEKGGTPFSAVSARKLSGKPSQGQIAAALYSNQNRG